MGKVFDELLVLQKAFGEQNYNTEGMEYIELLKANPLINSQFAVGNNFIIIANTYTWEFSLVVGNCEQLTGYSADEIRQKKADFIMNYTIPEHLPVAMATVTSTINYLKSRPLEERESIYAIYYYHARKKNGDLLSLQHQSVPIVFDKQMIPYLFCNIFSDITYLKPTNIPQGIIMNRFTNEIFHVNPEAATINKRNNIFSAREMEIIRLLTKGFSSKQISDHLSIKPETVRTHRKNILSKAGLSSSTALVKYCLMNGFL